MSNILDGNWTFTGYVKLGGTATLPVNCVGNNNWNPTDPLSTDNQVHAIYAKLGEKRGASVTNNTGEVIHVAQAAGLVDSVQVTAAVNSGWTGSGQVEIDVKKNGTTIMSIKPVIVGATAPFAVVDGTILTAAYVAGDVFEVVRTVTAGTGTPAQGVGVLVIFKEGAP